MKKEELGRPEAKAEELNERELEDISGGAWYAKFDGVDGSSESTRTGGDRLIDWVGEFNSY